MERASGNGHQASEKAAVRSYHDLEVWKRGRVLATSIYALTRQFPKEELYGLTSQMRRAAVSIPSNIAEGHSRRGLKDYIQFISMAIGSLAELETQLFVSLDLAFGHAEDIHVILEDVRVLRAKLHALRNSLRAQS